MIESIFTIDNASQACSETPPGMRLLGAVRRHTTLLRLNMPNKCYCSTPTKSSLYTSKRFVKLIRPFLNMLKYIYNFWGNNKVPSLQLTLNEQPLNHRMGKKISIINLQHKT